jgi:hypothetical protein
MIGAQVMRGSPGNMSIVDIPVLKLHHKQPDFTRRFYVIPNEREESLRPLFPEFGLW